MSKRFINKVIIDKQKELNMEVASMLKNSDSSITNLRLISLGNSIASGYSMVRTIKPLLLRNDSIESIMKEYEKLLSKDISYKKIYIDEKFVLYEKQK